MNKEYEIFMNDLEEVFEHFDWNIETSCSCPDAIVAEGVAKDSNSIFEKIQIVKRRICAAGAKPLIEYKVIGTKFELPWMAKFGPEFRIVRVTLGEDYFENVKNRFNIAKKNTNPLMKILNAFKNFWSNSVWKFKT